MSSKFSKIRPGSAQPVSGPWEEEVVEPDRARQGNAVYNAVYNAVLSSSPALQSLQLSPALLLRQLNIIF